ncbi:MAG TPA: adenylate/guanylate cyclase domain-containing protein [Acidimicrobiales bacterium]|nr:adenylate/guanylate cyclase domain-containing protein [Acidimicrobiales bacterium]
MLAHYLGWQGRAGRLLMALQWRTGFANTAGVLTVFGFLAISAGSAGLASQSDRVALVGAGVFVLVAALLGPILEGRAFAPVRMWLDEGGAPTSWQRRALLAQPLWQAGLNLGYWLVAALVLGIVSATAVGGTGREVARVVTALVLAGIMSFGLSFLLVERRLRPIYALALADLSPEEAGRLGARRLGIRTVLWLAWALGSGVALLGIVAEPLDHVPGRSLSVGNPGFYLAVVGLIVGAVVSFIAAGSVSQPLQEIEAAMRRVAGGDLRASVAVDDPGEIGILQSGFNTMVAGLRERERLDDLFGRYVGIDVARRALEGQTTLDGELREVSILFVDLIGSTHLALSKPPHDVVTDLNAMFDAVVATAKTEGGWVNKFLGDGALCVFGAPARQADHAARALRTGGSLRRRLASLAIEHPDLDVGIGISTGPVLAGNVGAQERYEYTVIGDPVNEAARLTDLAKTTPGRILASATTVEHAEGLGGSWCQEGEVVLRGRSEPTRFCSPGDE